MSAYMIVNVDVKDSTAYEEYKARRIALKLQNPPVGSWWSMVGKAKANGQPGS